MENRSVVKIKIKYFLSNKVAGRARSDSESPTTLGQVPVSSRCNGDVPDWKFLFA